MTKQKTTRTRRKPLPRASQSTRPFFFDDPAADKVLNMVITLGGEVWALRERLAAFEAVQIRQGSLSDAEIDEYEFAPEQETRLAADRKEFIDNLFRALQEPVEGDAQARKRAPRARARARVPATSRRRPRKAARRGR
jgi:hypothetical protein